VYAARDRFVAVVSTNTDKLMKLAIKVVYWPNNFSPEVEREVLDKLKQLKCPNILYPLDSGDIPDIGFFFVTPYIEQMPPPNTFPDVWKYLYNVALAIEGCHNNKIVHLDIKPKNILYSKSGDVYLCDFESAREVEDDDPTAVGTLRYWSPEVCDGNHSANDFPRDMWAFGVLIIETVYQKYPFSCEIPTDYSGMDLERGRAIALKKSIKHFLSQKQEGDLPWPQLLCDGVSESNKQQHIKLQKLLESILMLTPKARASAKQAVCFIAQILNAQKKSE